jgi:hypothetical protein
MTGKILVVGPPGSGKTTAGESLDPKETFFICSDRKGLPFKGWKKNYKTVTKENGKLNLQESNYYETSNATVVINLLKAISEQRPDIKVVVIDTITAIMENEYMNRAKEKGFDKYTDMALDTFNIIIAPDDLRDDLAVIIVAHDQDDYDAEGGLKTSFKVVGGKLIGQNIKVEGRFNLVLYSDVTLVDNKPVYSFLTQSNGRNTCRTPKGMFSELKIPNDYSLVIKTMREYYQD